MHSGKLLAAAALACAFGIAPMALASGSGSSGMSSGGMSSTPHGGDRDPAVAYQAGVAALQAHNYTEAIHQFGIAQYAAPNNGVVNYALGLSYIGANDKNNARDALRRAVHDDSSPPGAHLQYALVSIELGDRNAAVEQQTWAQHAVAACDAACGDARRGQLQAAYDQITQALNPPTPAAAPNATTPSTTTNPATTGWNFPSVQEGRQSFAEAVGLLNQARYEEALSALARTQAAVGPHPDILTYMGFANRKLGRYDQSFAYYREALAIDPDNLGVNEYLGELYVQLGDMPRARQQLARLDDLCAYGCAQREELAHWIQASGR
ncbi:MAG: tetratricopeptide repeat protein [Vitreimonas sp.]